VKNFNHFARYAEWAKCKL